MVLEDFIFLSHNKNRALAVFDYQLLIFKEIKLPA